MSQYCFECHNDEVAEARVNLARASEAPDFGRDFKDWEKVLRMLREQKMPPEEMLQPELAVRRRLVESIEGGLASYVTRHAGDPGLVTIRRLTSAEYAYTIQDLTGLELNVAEGFVSDAVSGEGFTNAGDAQFMQDSTLERYLEAAKLVAFHAVIGSGPVDFFADPGQTGLELSAITRIQDLYRAHGFRTAAGEGAEPFGLDLYPRAMLVAWQYRHREQLGCQEATIAELARREGVSVRLCEHVWSVLNRTDTPFPLSIIVSQWQALPPPAKRTGDQTREACDGLCDLLRDWQSALAAAASDEEEAAVLTAGEVRVSLTHSFRADISWPEGAQVAEFEFSVSRASDQSVGDALVIWRDARLQFRGEDLRRGERQPLAALVAEQTSERLGFGNHPAGAAVGEHDFVLRGETSIPIVLHIPPGKVTAQLFVDVELDVDHGASSIVRCRIADGEVEGETAAEVGDVSTLLADPTSEPVARWQAGVAEFARLLPEVSHREPAPSDRDPIPAPFDNAYNRPERNHFHYAIKYHRDDEFFMRHIADDATRLRLDQAWTDLLMSFEYHDAWLRFVAGKFSLDLQDRGIAELDEPSIEQLPAEPAAVIRRLRAEFFAMRESLRVAETGHVEDLLQLAERAWRRPLSPAERRRLRAYYEALRRDERLSHVRATRSLLARILVAPAFLYRVEIPSELEILPLSDWQLASRLSYFIWSSVPDETLREAAAQGHLGSPQELEQHVRRMLQDPKARRLATEFFGQWLGFYRFDRFRGIDSGRYGEFTEELKSAMHQEAVSFFEHIIRNERPADEIVFADYTFLNRLLAEHYGVPAETLTGDRWMRIERVSDFHRGGVLGFGAVLTSTSAPLRTSAVKRGDWVLRRLVGTPVPPPPADAGSITADEVSADGLTVRQRLEAHRAQPACVNCHARIDPLGFALEHFDTIGRWRDTYLDGQAIDSTGVLSDGTTIAGPAGLRAYLRREKTQFHRTLCTKLVGYALGRSELLSDRPLIAAMMRELDRGGSVADLVVGIVLSDQFRHQRGDGQKSRTSEKRNSGENSQSRGS